MPAGQQDTLALIGQAHRAHFILIVALEEVLASVDVADSEGKRTPLQGLGDQGVLLFLR